MEQVSCNKIFGGLQKVFKHTSAVLKCSMNFAIYLPRLAETEKVPVLYWLSGLTCTEQNFITKAGAQRYAAEHGIAIVCPDTSPRGVPIPGDDDAYDFGTGAGFYVDATRDPWKTNYRMYSYVVDELPKLIAAEFSVDAARQAISGHSMGGHGALTIFLRNPGKYASVSAFSPICNPMQCDWGRKAFTGYFGEAETAAWRQHDATELAKSYAGAPVEVLIDQGKGDDFLAKGQLLPDNFVAASVDNKCVSVNLRMQDGYDHSYYFISTFIGEHIAHHAKFLKN